MSLTVDEMAELNQRFQEMGAKPKFDTVNDLQGWMLQYLTSQGKLPEQAQKDNEDDKDDSASEPEVEVIKTQAGIGSYQQVPRVATFSGDVSSKGDTTFDLWKFEVDCLIKGGIHSEAVLCQAVRKSLRGDAAHTVKRLGADASLVRIMKKMQDVYGVIETGETLLAEFYTARQRSDEDVTAWGCRLEDLVDRARAQLQIPDQEVGDKLCSRFWEGLPQRLKDASRHLHNSIKDFDELRKSVRLIEREYKLADQTESQKKAQVKMTSVTDDSDSPSVKKLEGMVYKLSNQVEAMHKHMTDKGQGDGRDANLAAQVGQAQERGPGQGLGDPRGIGHDRFQGGWQRNPGPGQDGAGPPWQQYSYPRPPQQVGQQPPHFPQPAPVFQGQQGHPHQGQRAPQFQGQRAPPFQGQQNFPRPPRQSQDARFQGGNRLVCYKCNEEGHIRLDCPRRYEPTCWYCGRLGHRQPQCPELNYRDPLSQGGR